MYVMCVLARMQYRDLYVLMYTIQAKPELLPWDSKSADIRIPISGKVVLK